MNGYLMNRNLIRIGSGLFFLLLTSGSFIRAGQAAQAAQAAQATEVTFEQDNNLPLVYLNFTVKAGAVTDPAGKSGLTNFMAEMLLRGTKSRSKGQLDLALDQMGARLEVETRSEALILRGAVLSSELKHFLNLLSEIITEPSFPEGEIKKLKAEVKSQIAEELGQDSSLGMRRFAKFLFRKHPYGKPVLGTTQDIQRLNRTDLLSQYDLLIREPNFLLVGTGDATPEEVSEWVRGVATKRPPLATKMIEPVSAPQDAPLRRLQLVDKPSRTQTQINIGQIGVRMTDPEFFPLYLGNYAFGGGSFSVRLMTEIRVKRGWSYGANSFFRQGLRPRSWQAHLFPATKDTSQALSLTLKMIEDLGAKGITEDEFQSAKQSLVNSAGFMYNTPRKRVENALLERTLNLPDGFMKSYGGSLSQVKIEEVNSALSTFLKPGRLSISVLCTAKDLKEPLLKAAGVKASQLEVIPYTQE